MGGSCRFALALCLLAATPALARAQPPPDEAWRTIETAHFRVTFPEHLEAVGRRAAELAERARARLEEQFIEAPSGQIDLVVTDHVDQSNGYATVWPSNRIVAYIRPPTDSLALGYFEDNLELLIVHELAHIHQLDYPGGFGRFFRRLFGRSPTIFSFPGTDAPGWVIEGIGTWYESALTGAGRIHGTFHEMVLRTAALEGRFETVGQAGGNSPVWPGGTRRYAYGSLFFDHLLETYGQDRMGAFARELVSARTQLFGNGTLNGAATRIFGVSLTDAWRTWADGWRAEAGGLDSELARYGSITEPERVTRRARYAQHPTVSADGASLIYVRSDGRSDPQLVAEHPAGGGRRSIARTNHVTTFDLLPSGAIVFDQLDFSDRYRVFSDLYVAETGGAVRRVTTGARLTAPAAEPDGASVVAVSEGNGTQGLVRVNLSDGTVTNLVEPESGIYWAYPAVSPDGRWIAASRWADKRHDLVILDADGNLRHQVTRDRALDFAPAWSPDGRHLVWSSDRSGIPNIFAVMIALDTGATGAPVMLTNVRTGALFPSVDPSGAWLYFSGYHVDGWDVERTRFSLGQARPAPPLAPRFDIEGTATAFRPASATAPTGAGAPDNIPSARPYAPMRTLWPTWWLPSLRGPIAVAGTADGRTPRKELLGWSIGGQTSGVDVVGRHAWMARARTFTSGGKGEGAFSYEYRGLANPTLGFSLSQRWDDEGVRFDPRQANHASPDPYYVLARERRAAVSVRLDRASFRTPVSLTVSGGLVRQDRELLDDALEAVSHLQLRRPSTRLGEAELTLHASTARSHAFQMGNARGASVSVRTRLRRDLDALPAVPGSGRVDSSVNDVIGRARAYVPLPWPGYGASVLAFRATAGAAHGPGSATGYFDVGGASETLIPAFSLLGAPGVSVLFPVRGYETAARSGRRAWSASVEYRMPIALVNQAPGAWALHLDRILGSVFVDAGDAWGTDHLPESTSSSVLLSAGIEMTSDLLLAYSPFRVRFGVAFPLVEADGPRYYLRFGLPF